MATLWKGTVAPAKPTLPSVCPAGTVCDYSELSQEQFWVAMARRNYLWPYKADGTAADIHELPSLLPQTVEGAWKAA
jgi:hypothetical protein